MFVYNLLPKNQKSRRRDSCEIRKSIWRMKLRIHFTQFQFFRVLQLQEMSNKCLAFAFHHNGIIMYSSVLHLSHLFPRQKVQMHVPVFSISRRRSFDPNDNRSVGYLPSPYLLLKPFIQILISSPDEEFVLSLYTRIKPVMMVSHNKISIGHKKSSTYITFFKTI